MGGKNKKSAADSQGSLLRFCEDVSRSEAISWLLALRKPQYFQSY